MKIGACAGTGDHAPQWLVGRWPWPQRQLWRGARPQLRAILQHAEFLKGDARTDLLEDPAIQKDYDRFSPHRFVQHWDTPLMVIHGQQDFRVPLEQGLQAFTAAQLQGCPSRFVYFPTESHWVLSPQNGVLWHRLFFDWLGRHLGG